MTNLNKRYNPICSAPSPLHNLGALALNLNGLQSTFSAIYDFLLDTRRTLRDKWGRRWLMFLISCVVSLTPLNKRVYIEL